MRGQHLLRPQGQFALIGESCIFILRTLLHSACSSFFGFLSPCLSVSLLLSPIVFGVCPNLCTHIFLVPCAFILPSAARFVTFSPFSHCTVLFSCSNSVLKRGLAKFHFDSFPCIYCLIVLLSFFRALMLFQWLIINFTQFVRII